MNLRDNYLTSPMQGLEDLLLASPTFVASTGLASIEQIRQERIHWGTIERDELLGKKDRPLGLLLDTEDTGWSAMAESDGESLYAGGSVELYLSADTLDKNDHTASFKAFAAWAGTVVQEMRDVNGIGNHYYFNGIMNATRCIRTPKSERANYDFFFLLVMATFGEDGR